MSRGYEEGTARRRAIAIVQLVLVLVFVAQLVAVFLIPLRSNSLSPTWWTWMQAAAPLVLLAAFDQTRRRRGGLRLPADAAERIRGERHRVYGRTH